MTAQRLRHLPLGVEVLLASGVGVGTFALVAALLMLVDGYVLAAAVGVPCVVGVILLARRLGAAFAVPPAMAAVLAYDWYVFPPTHDELVPDGPSLANLVVYLAVATLVGELAAYAGRRAEASERARGVLADEQAALRRVATLVAQNLRPEEVFAAVAREVGTLIGADAAYLGRYEPEGTVIGMGGWSRAGDALPRGTRASVEGDNVTARVLRTGRPARMDAYDDAAGPIGALMTEQGIRSSVGAPIVVDGRLWGVVIASTKGERPLGPDTEARIAAFTELVATAISNTEARTERERLAEQQAALRRVATLVAREASQAEVFAAIAEELGRLMHVDHVRMWRFEGDDDAVIVASAGTFGEAIPVGAREHLDADSLAGRVRSTRGSQRVDDYAELGGPVGSAVATPIEVEGRLWGAMVAVARQRGRLAVDTEARIGQFTELMATAIANSESRARADRLAEEQAALRRVATLVAANSRPDEVFAAVGEEVRRLVGNDLTSMFRREPGDMLTLVAVRARVEPVPDGLVGARIPMRAKFARFLEAGQPVRLDVQATAQWMTDLPAAKPLGLKSAIGAPIIVGGRPWGAIFVCDTAVDGLPPEAERPFVQFTELVGTAIANAQARTEVSRLADEQAALRRVATLVAQGASPTTVFDAVAAEIAALMGADGVTLARYESGDELTVVAHRGSAAPLLPPGTRLHHGAEGVSGAVRRTQRPVRIESYAAAGLEDPELVEALGIRAAVGAPIVVEGRLWGVTVAQWGGEHDLPAATEERMAQFAELLDTAIANADSRDQLTASRARLLTAGDEARRRVVRDLHDGAQQRLVHTIVTLSMAQQALRESEGRAESLVAEALEHARLGNTELRELAHGILPAALTHGGLRAAVDAVVARLDLPVDVDLPAERFPREIEASAYFIVAEALTNVVKHAQASRAEVTAHVEDGYLRVEVRDDGLGGVDPEGNGVVGMDDRVSALGGRLEIDSPPGGGTLLAATLPV